MREIYKDGALVFADPEFTPKDGTKVIITYFEEVGTAQRRAADPLQSLRGRGRGERLVERLLQSRREDREGDEPGHPSRRP